MPNQHRESCPQCRKPFVGAVEILTTTTCGTATTELRETSDRNWIECDLCSLMICKSCCADAASGICNSCLKEPEI